MSDNKTLILKEFEKLKGQFVISDNWHTERLIAIGEDEWDYYYITYDGREIHWHTCVSRIMPLKGYLRDEDYNELVRIAKLNHYDQVDFEMNGNMDNFLKAFQKEIEAYDKNSIFITDPCWNLEYVTIKDIRKRKIRKIEKEM